MSAMGDFYLRIAEQAGLDPDDETTLDRVSRAVAQATGPALIDVFDEAVDALLLEAV